MINIIAINSQNEPFNLDYTNVKETIYFSYLDTDPISNPLEIMGNEKWVWNFDAGTSGTSEYLPMEIIGFNQPISVSFIRPGSRAVSLDVYEDSGTNWTLKYNHSIVFNVYEFPSEIIGPDFAPYNQDVDFYIDSIYTPQKYEWFVNGTIDNSSTSSNFLLQDLSSRSIITCIITNGTQSITLSKTCIVTTPNTVFGKQYESNITPNLLFFNKEGDNLNFDYIEDVDGITKWQGDLIFHPNSSDTFKTIGLYVLENVDPIKISSPDLILEKMQYFNGFGMDFEKKWADDIEITKIEPVNSDPNYYSKWIYGTNINRLIPLGSEIYFTDINSVGIDSTSGVYLDHQPIQDFNSFTNFNTITYTVVGSKANAIMVLTETDNATYSSLYGPLGSLGQDYMYGKFRDINNTIYSIPVGKVKTINLIKIYSPTNVSNEWNEPSYKALMYDQKKVSLVNTQKNDGVYTITYPEQFEKDIASKKVKIDTVFYNSLIPNPQYGFKIDVKFKTSQVLLSSTPIDFLPYNNNNGYLMVQNILIWQTIGKKDFTPKILKPGLEFFFDNTSSEHNFEFLYECLELDTAKNILNYQTTDEQGFRLTLKKWDTLKNFTFTFTVNNKSKYTLVEGVDWYRGLNINEATFNLSNAINNKIIGITTIAQQNEVWIWEKQNHTIINTNNIDDNTFTWANGILDDNTPDYGVVGDNWVYLNDPYFNGYVHYRKNQGNFHIVYFDGSSPNYTKKWYVLPDSQKVAAVDVINPNLYNDTLDYKIGLMSNAYLKESVISFTQLGDATVTSDVLVQRFITQYNKAFQNYGLDVFESPTMPLLGISRNYLTTGLNSEQDYVDISFYYDNGAEILAYEQGTNGTSRPDDYVLFSSTTSYYNIDLLMVEESLNTEYNRVYGKYNKPKSIGKNWERKIIIKDLDYEFGFVLTINGIDYPVSFDNISSNLTVEEDMILDIEQTLFNWGNQRFSLKSGIKLPSNPQEIGKKYYQVLESLGVLVWLEKSIESYVQGEEQYDTIVIQSKYPNVNIRYAINGTLDQHKILHSDIEFYEIGNNLTITINNQPYTIPYQGSIESTLASWKHEYEYVLLEQAIIVDHFTDSTSGTSFIDLNNNILRFSTRREDDTFSYTIWVGKTPTPGNLLYNITDWRPGQAGIIMTGNEVSILNGADFQEMGFSTGMITSISNSMYPLNNQEYNIVFVNPVKMGLSYQGPFWSNDTNSYIIDRSGFDWEVYNETSSGNGYNFILNSTFDNLDWWVYNESTSGYHLDNNHLISKSQYGFQTQYLELANGTYELQFTSHDEGSNFQPIGYKVYQVNSPTNFTLIDQVLLANFGTYSKTYTFNNSSIIYIQFADGSTTNYYSISDVTFIRLPETTTIPDLSLNTRQFLRYPRERFDGEDPIQLKVSWLEEENTDDSMFFYDFSGVQLAHQNQGIYQYSGITPLITDNNVFLNDKPNKDLTKIKDPKAQQTVFDNLVFDLKLIDSEDDLSPLPSPLQFFIGYNSMDEGVNKRTLLIHRLENIKANIVTKSTTDLSNNITWSDIIEFNSERQQISLVNSTLNFIDLGFKVGQRVRITGVDNSSSNNQAVFKNAGFEGEITIVNVALMEFKPLNKRLVSESSLVTTRNIIPPFRSRTVGLDITIDVIPQEIARIQLKGQTEIEDERFKVMLNNFGYNINQKDSYIFKEYDLSEAGIDWTYINKKRKEMLLVYPEIYNYLGSYKALVNAINYFGYNDLILNEYYQNVDETSKQYNKLTKIEIPDIFDNTVPGWTSKDYIIKSLPDPRYIKTKLFNLTYRITDNEGNNILGYSLDEVITKLLGLKLWLQDKIMPIGTRIKDITGLAETNHNPMVWHDVKNHRKLIGRENLTPVDFKIEAYLQPVENHSRTYNLHIDFFTSNENYKPESFQVKISTYGPDTNFDDPNYKLHSVRTIHLFKTDLESYNFVADLNLDPLIVVEVSSENGYGGSYTIKKSYTLRYNAI